MYRDPSHNSDLMTLKTQPSDKPLSYRRQQPSLSNYYTTLCKEDPDFALDQPSARDSLPQPQHHCLRYRSL